MEVPVYTDVDRETFLRDIYPLVTRVVYMITVICCGVEIVLRVNETHVSHLAQTSGSKARATGALCARVDGELSRRKRGRPRSQSARVPRAQDGLSA